MKMEAALMENQLEKSVVHEIETGINRGSTRP